MTDTKICAYCRKTITRGTNICDYNWSKTVTHLECRGPYRNYLRRMETERDTCKRCGETKPISKFKRSKKAKKGYTQPCKACDSAKNKLGGQWLNTKHLDPYLTIPWTMAA